MWPSLPISICSFSSISLWHKKPPKHTCPRISHAPRDLGVIGQRVPTEMPDAYSQGGRAYSYGIPVFFDSRFDMITVAHTPGFRCSNFETKILLCYINHYKHAFLGLDGLIKRHFKRILSGTNIPINELPYYPGIYITAFKADIRNVIFFLCGIQN